MSKKYLLFGIVTLLIISIVFFFFSLIQQSQTKDQLTKRGYLFVETWGSYKDASATEYTESLRPFLTDDEFQKVQRTAEKQKMFIEQGYLPNRATTDNISCSTDRQGKRYLTTCSYTQTIIDYKTTQNIMKMEWGVSNKKLLINNWYTKE